MRISVIKKLEVEKEVEKGDDYNNFFELGVEDNVTIWTKDGQCYAAEIKELLDDKIIITDEENEIKHVPLAEIEDIEEG